MTNKRLLQRADGTTSASDTITILASPGTFDVGRAAAKHRGNILLVPFNVVSPLTLQVKGHASVVCTDFLMFILLGTY